MNARFQVVTENTFEVVSDELMLGAPVLFGPCGSTMLAWLLAEGGLGDSSTWALVPWKAKELTPHDENADEVEERPLLCLGAAMAPLRACAGREEIMCGLSEERWSTGWILSEWRDETADSMPMMPAEGSVCPMPLLSAANTSGLGRLLRPSREGSSTAAAAPTSIGSPRPVPVCARDQRGVKLNESSLGSREETFGSNAVP